MILAGRFHTRLMGRRTRQAGSAARTTAAFLFLILGLTFTRPTVAQEPPALLPLIELTVNEETLARILANPWSGEEADAELVYGDRLYPCRIRLRGNTSRTLPKPSWRIEFESDRNDFDREILILRAEYRDESYMRNHLMHRLFDRLEVATPETRFVSLRINGTEQGVYLQVERIDNAFLKARDLPRGDLFSIEFNAGRWYPYMHRADFLTGWVARTLTAGGYERVERALMRIGYSSYEDFPDHVRALFDIDQILLYYATVYVVYARDAVIDNYYVYRNPETGLFQFIPWDVDASLGMAFDGRYRTENETEADWYYFNSALLQRMLEYEEWQELFAEKVAYVSGIAFDFLAEEALRTAPLIRDAVLADPYKAEMEPRFDAEVDTILYFLGQRRVLFDEIPSFRRIPAGNLRVSNPFPSPDSSVVVMQAYSAEPQRMQVWLAHGVQVEEWSSTHQDEYVNMNDDGVAPDSIAGDGWYAAEVDLSAYSGERVPLGVLAHQNYVPAASVFNTHYLMSATYTLNLDGSTLEDYQSLVFESIDRAGTDQYVAILNTGERPLDLSSFFFQAGPYYQRVVIPWNTIVNPDQHLVIASNATGASQRFPDAVVVGGLAFEVSETDTLRLLSPMQTLVVAGETAELHHELPRVVINEINYNSHDALDTGDWIELHNPTDEAISLSGWQVRDGDDDHVFTLPQDALLAPRGYVVIAESQHRLMTLMKVESPVYGDADFGFDGAGELVRLFNGAGELVASVEYSDDDPWPQAPDGDGYTLELIGPTLDFTQAENWSSSLGSGGTPGRANSVTTADEPDERPEAFVLRSVFPNPTRDFVEVLIDVDRTTPVEIALYDVLGRQLARETRVQTPGAMQIMALDLRPYAAGTYLIAIRAGEHLVAARSVVRVR